MKKIITLTLILFASLFNANRIYSSDRLTYINIGISPVFSISKISYVKSELGKFSYSGYGGYFQMGSIADFGGIAWNFGFYINPVSISPIISETKQAAVSGAFEFELKYCFNSRRHISPYLGVGFGYQVVRVEYTGESFPIGQDNFESANAGFAFNFLGGVYIPITSQSLDLNIGVISPIIVFSTPKTSFNNLMLNIGLGIKF